MRREVRSSNFVFSLVKRIFASIVLSSTVIATGSTGIQVAHAAAVAPRVIMYQGRLLNSNSVPVSDTTASVSFALYNELSSGAPGDTCLWSNNSSTCASIVARTVTLTAGLFSEALGDTAAGVPYAAIPASVFSDDGTVYLQVVVNGETLTPRKQMLASAYAMNSDSVDGFDTSTTGATSSVVPVTDSNGNLVITGAPQGPGVHQGSVYLNPASAAANRTLFGVAVAGVSRFTLDAEGDSSFLGAMTVTGSIGAADFTCTNCLDFTELNDSLALDATTSLNIGTFDFNTSGTGALGFGSTGQVTFAGNVDANNGADVTVGNLTVGGNKLIVSPTSGNISTAGTGTASFGSSGQVTFTGNIDANSGVDIVGANLSVGGTNFVVVPGSGNVSTAGTGTANFASTGQVTFAGNVDSTNGLDVTGANFTVGGTKFTIDPTTGNVGTTGSGTANFGSSGQVTFAANVDANNGLDVMGAALTVGGANFSVSNVNGNVITAGDIGVNGGDLTSSAATFNLLDANVTTLTIASGASTINFGDSVGTKTIDIGGNDNNGTDTIRIATQNTNADTVMIGNSNSSTALSLSGGSAWFINSSGSFTTSGSIATNGSGTANFGSNGQVTFAGNVDANSGVDITGAALTVGGGNFSVSNTNGNIITNGDLGLNGGDVTSTGFIKLTSGGSGDIVFDPASALVSITANKDLAVGGASLSGSSFSVDSSANAFRFGTGSTANALISLYGSDGDTGDLSYQTDDTLHFTGGYFQHDGPNILPSGMGQAVASTNIITSLSGTSGNNLQNVQNFGLMSDMQYAAIEGSGTTAEEAVGIHGSLNISGATSVLTFGSAIRGSLNNNSTNAALLEAGGFLSVVNGIGTQNAAATTVADMRGITGQIASKAGTITNGYGLYGDIGSGSGTITNSYSVFAKNTGAGTSRYGVFSQASGGTNNFAGYFTGSRVQIDADLTPDAPSVATGNGDLYVAGNFENRNQARFGDGGAGDDFIFSSGIQNSPAIQMLVPNLVGGIGLGIQRTDDASGTAFTGDLLHVEQDDVTAGANNAVNIIQKAGGNTLGLIIQQDNIANQTNGAGGTTIGGQALVLETSEAASNDDIMLIRSNGQLVLAIETDGSVLSDNGYSAAGADYAEYFPSNDSTLAFYEMVCADTGRPMSVKRCEAGNMNPMGIMSSDPGFIGNMPEDGDTGNVLVGMVGQIDTYVNADEGAIAVGDPISTSLIVAGYGAKAHGPVRIMGFALEALSSGRGTIKILVQPQWYGGDVLTRVGSATQVAGSLAIASTTSATASSTAIDSGALLLRGSAWSGGAAQPVGMSIKTVVSAVNDYKLSVMNTAGAEVASVGYNGDFAIAGKLYPSDRGATQRSKYIYYDGSSGSGGDFMRTNAAGWSTGSYDFAEMFPSPDTLVAGEVVMFGDASQQVKRSTGETYNRKIAGIVSTRPGFLAGENRAGNYPIALAGRVPTLVSTENGAISIGDPLTTSSRPGYAMKATEPGPIIGYAADSFSGSMGSVVVFVNVSYYSGAPVATGPAAQNTISQLSLDIQNFDTAGTLNFNGGRLLAVGSMTSASGAWKLEDTGDLVTSGRLIELVRSATGENVETYAATSRQMTVQLSGTIVLDRGHADVKFADIDPSFTGIIDPNATYRALVTPYGATGALYVTNRTVDGFIITESGAASTGVSVDWLVVAARRDYAPVPASVPVLAPSVIPTTDASAGSTDSVISPLPEVSVPTVPLDAVVTPDDGLEPVVAPVDDAIDSADPVLSPQDDGSSDIIVSSDSDSGASVSTDAPSASLDSSVTP